MDILGSLIAIAAWGMIIIISSLIASLIAQLGNVESKFTLGLIIQGLYVILSLIAALMMGGLKGFGLSLNIPITLAALVIAVPIGIPPAYIASKLARDYKPPFIPENFRERAIIALIVAPLGEEFLFRGLLEGQLLKNMNLWLAIAIPALLFSIIHTIPFSDSPRGFLYTLLVTALIIGLLAGYLRAISGSLSPAIITHASFNLAGMLVDQLLSS